MIPSQEDIVNSTDLPHLNEEQVNKLDSPSTENEFTNPLNPMSNNKSNRT